MNKSEHILDVNNVKDYNRNIWKLEEFLLFCIFVANKPAHITANKLNIFLNLVDLPELTPIQRVEYLEKKGRLMFHLQNIKFGQYNRLYNSMLSLIEYRRRDSEFSRKITLEELELIKGIGRKTSRFFLINTRENIECAVLDTHILKFIKKYLVVENVPRSTPNNDKEYNRYSKVFIDFCYRNKLNIADSDLFIWKCYNQDNLELLDRWMKGKS